MCIMLQQNSNTSCSSVVDKSCDDAISNDCQVV